MLEEWLNQIMTKKMKPKWMKNRKLKHSGLNMQRKLSEMSTDSETDSSQDAFFRIESGRSCI